MPLTEDTSLAEHPFRGPLRAFCAIVIVFLLTTICWCIWASVAHRRLQAQIGTIAALHQPFWRTDFASVHLSDGENAVKLWAAAAAARPANDTCPSGSNFVFNDYPPYSLQWQQMEDQSVADNTKLFELADRAATKEADWGVLTPATPLPGLNDSRAVANILADAVIHAHLRGDDALAFQRLTDLFELSRSVGRLGYLIGRLVSIGIQELATERLLSIAPDLVIAGDAQDQPSASHAGVPRKAIEAMIRQLLDETDENRMRLTVLDMERMNSHEVYQAEKRVRLPLRPMLDLMEIQTLKELAIDRLATEAPSHTAGQAVYIAHRRPVIGPPPVAFTQIPGKQQPAMALWAGVYEGKQNWMPRYLNIDWQAMAERPIVAVALAIRLFREDHHQAWPDALTDLVPAYLPAIPIDPFAANPTPIGYIIRKAATPDGHDRPMLYFGVTGDPAKASLPANPSFGWFQANVQWNDLSRWYPVAASTTPSNASPATTASSP